MKTLIAIILFITTTSVFVIRSYKIPPVMDVSVFGDITESIQAQPQADEIFAFFRLEENKWSGVEFRFMDISDVSLNRASETKLAPANQWFSNELEREKEIIKFKSRMIEILSGSKVIGKKHSSVYVPLARELNRLSQSKADRKILLIYSDLMENSPRISFYDSKTYELFQSNPDLPKNLFKQMQPLNSLTGIEVYLIYEPVDTAQDEAFKIVSEFYQKLLEEKGAQVTISANL